MIRQDVGKITGQLYDKGLWGMSFSKKMESVKPINFLQHKQYSIEFGNKIMSPNLIGPIYSHKPPGMATLCNLLWLP
jgi:hypothetical protein